MDAILSDTAARVLLMIALPLAAAAVVLVVILWAALREAWRRQPAPRSRLAPIPHARSAPPIARGKPGPLYDASTGPARQAREREAEVV